MKEIMDTTHFQFPNILQKQTVTCIIFMYWFLKINLEPITVITHKNFSWYLQLIHMTIIS